MLSRRILSVAGLALALELISPSAKAELITFEFTGHVTRLEGDLGFLGGSIPVGISFTGGYTFDSNTPDLYPDFPDLGHYDEALTAFWLHIGPHSVISNGMNDRISVADDLESFEDSYVVQSRSLPLLSRIVNCTIVLVDYSMTAFSTDALPLEPPPLGAFQDRDLVITDASPAGRFSIAGQITALTPEPSSLAFMLACLPAILRRTHREQDRFRRSQS